MRTTLAPRWEEINIKRKMEVYYAYLTQAGDDAMSFEEFDEANRRTIFKYVKSLYMGA